jgi:hypothetical protein
MNGFRNWISAIFLIAFPLSGCIAYIAHDIPKGNLLLQLQQSRLSRRELC